MNKIRQFYRVYIFLFLMLCASVAFAQSVNGPSAGGGVNGPTADGGVNGPVGTAQSITIESPIAAKSITELFQTILDVVLVFAIPIVVFFIIYAGFLYVTARGNEKTIEQAHKALLYALIGGLLILGARVLIDVISGTVDAVIH